MSYSSVLPGCLSFSFMLGDCDLEGLCNKNIFHNPEIDFQTVTVEFTNMHPVNTVFKYVKNLAPEQKVYIFIPDPRMKISRTILTN